MAEVLGVVSAATQLATLCCSLLRVMKKIKGAGLTLQNYELQLQDLSLLSSSISRNPLLQTSEIGTLTQSLLSLISQANLTFVLKKHRIIRTLYILCKERDLVDTLTAVERQKLSLCLSIEQIQSDTLYEIRASIQDMSFEKQNSGKRRTAAQETTKKNPAPPSDNSGLKMSSAPSERSTAAATAGNNRMPAPPVGTDAQRSYVANNPSGRTMTNDDYTNIKVSGDTDVHMGLAFAGKARELPYLSSNTNVSEVCKAGKGNMHIGPDLCCPDEIKTKVDLGSLATSVNGLVFEGFASKSGERSQLRMGPNLNKRKSGERKNGDEKPQKEPEA